MKPPRISLEARLLALVAVVVVLALATGMVFGRRIGDAPWLTLGLGLTVLLPFAVVAVRLFVQPISAYFRALTSAIDGMSDGDFSLMLSEVRSDELGELARAYNRVGEVLRRERLHLYQRELLLDTVMQTSPQALLLLDAGERVIYSNSAARQLFRAGQRMEGLALTQVLSGGPPPLAEPIATGRDGLYTVTGEPDTEVMHLSQHRFRLNGRDHRLVQLRSLTREVARSELETWKKLIRVISHELNNSLAPISSLAHSGRLLLARGDSSRLDEVFATIEDRSARLKGFLEEYARFAKLPQPRRAAVPLPRFVERLRAACGVQLDGPVPAGTAWFDEAQLEQVLINLVKNACEAGGPADAIRLRVAQVGSELLLAVSDRGPGMSDAVLANALLPFYSTKGEGTGLGLTLCREIVEAHEGRLSLANREGGGLDVRILLPQGVPDPVHA